MMHGHTYIKFSCESQNKIDPDHEKKKLYDSVTHPNAQSQMKRIL